MTLRADWNAVTQDVNNGSVSGVRYDYTDDQGNATANIGGTSLTGIDDSKVKDYGDVLNAQLVAHKSGYANSATARASYVNNAPPIVQDGETELVAGQNPATVAVALAVYDDAESTQDGPTLTDARDPTVRTGTGGWAVTTDRPSASTAVRDADPLPREFTGYVATFTKPDAGWGAAGTVYTADVTFQDEYGETARGTATVQIVNPANRKPNVPANLSWSVQQGRSLEVDLAALVTDPDGDTLTLEVFQPPTDVETTITGTKMKFTAASDATTGYKAFTISASDGTATSYSVGWRIQVTGRAARALKTPTGFTLTPE